MKKLKRILIFLLCLALLPLPARAAEDWDASEQMQHTAAGLSGLHGKNGSILADRKNFPAGTSACDWTAIALALSGSREDYAAYLKELQAYVEEAYAAEGGLDRVKATPYHRIALTVLALGGDPTAFGKKSDGTPIDLVADGTYGFAGNIGAQGLNGWIYALLTLDACAVTVPEGAAVTRQEMLDAIVHAQEPDGGFGLAPGASDVDITAMALQALAPYAQVYPETVDAALAYLAAQMTDDGTFHSFGSESCESSAQILLALCALGIDPAEDARFVRGVETVTSGIDRFRKSDGTYSHLREEKTGDYLATAQMLLAVTALHKLRGGNGRIFDFAGYTGPDQQKGTSWIPLAAAGTAAAIVCILIMRKRRNYGKKNG